MTEWRKRVGSASTPTRPPETPPSRVSDQGAKATPLDRRVSQLSQRSSEAPTPTRRPSLFRTSISQQMIDAPVSSPQTGVGLDPARTDYFEQASSTRTSYRAAVTLGTVMAGRVLLSLGIGGISTGFGAAPVAPGLVRVAPPRATFGFGNGVVFELSIAATVVGCVLAFGGLGTFCLDTYALNPKRAAMMAAIAFIGVSGVASGGVVYVYGQSVNSQFARDMSLLPRTVGNFGVFYALPNSFATSEIVHGNVPIPNREQVRQISFALGGAILLLYGYISSPGIDAPQFAREITLGLGIVGICVGASMARTNNLRLASERRQLRSPDPRRRHSSLIRDILQRSV